MPVLRDSPDAEMPRGFDIAGRVIVVTGAAGILGSLYCARLAAAGAKVVAADVDEAACRKLAAEINREHAGGCEAAAVDLGREESVRQWAGAILDRHGRVDVLVNNAATKSPNFFAPLDDFPLADWNAVLAVNVTGIFLAVRELGPSMAARGKGSIINVSSIYGVVAPDPRLYEGAVYEAMGGAINTPLVYSTTKGAVLSMTRYLAAYWGPRGVRTNALTPGGVFSGQNDAFRASYGKRVPLGRMAEAGELIGALIFLASDASSYVNGQNLIVDGGYTIW